MVKVSVIIPLYNEGKFIGDTIATLKNQSFKYFECIIVDDGSTDNGIEACKKAINGDSRFLIIRHMVNSMAGAARNTGLLHASGEYVVFLDADDLFSKTCFAERLKIIEENPYEHVAGCYSRHMSINEKLRNAPDSRAIEHEVISFQSAKGDCPFAIHDAMTRRSIVMGVGGFDEKLIYGAEDAALWVKILRHGFVFLPTKTLNAFYRFKQHSLVRKESNGHLKASIALMSESNSELPDSEFYSIARMKMVKPVTSYIFEEKLINRIFQFYGISLAKNPDEDLTQYAEFISDVEHGFPFTLSYVDQIYKGIIRARPEAAQSWDVRESYWLPVQYHIQELLEKLKNSEKKCPSQENCRIYSPLWQRKVDLLFIPHEAYHAKTINILKPWLEKLGISFVVADTSALHHGESLRNYLQTTDMPWLSIPRICMGDFAFKGVIVFNDWEGRIAKPAVMTANEVGIPSMGIIEGINDYEDVDTGRKRWPYKTCKNVISSCKFDMKYFDDSKQNIYDGCIPRIFDLKEEARDDVYDKNRPILINSNFSYNVLNDKRQMFLESATGACADLDLPYLITAHPHDNGDFSAFNVTSENMYAAIRHCSIFVSRFGSGILEALAMNRPVIYYNPHNEKVDKFNEPLGAYFIAKSREELTWAIKETYAKLDELKSHWPDFLELHTGYRENGRSAALGKIASTIEEIINNPLMPSHSERKLFLEKYASKFKRQEDVIFKNITGHTA